MELDNDVKFVEEGIGGIQLEFRGPSEVKDVLHVPGLTKNLLVL